VLLSDYGYGDRASAIHNRKSEIKRLPSLSKEGCRGFARRGGVVEWMSSR
jgi:hypothetical protein